MDNNILPPHATMNKEGWLIIKLCTAEEAAALPHEDWLKVSGYIKLMPDGSVMTAQFQLSTIKPGTI